MHIRLLIIMIIILILGLTIIFALPKKLKKIGIVLGLGIIILLCATYGIYLLNPSFRQEVNLKFNTSSEHRYTLNNQSVYLPLPQKTTLSYRMSDTEAVYITKASPNEIFNFYSSIVDNNSLIKSNKGENMRLSFKYHGVNFTVLIENGTNNRTITVF